MALATTMTTEKAVGMVVSSLPWQAVRRRRAGRTPLTVQWPLPTAPEIVRVVVRVGVVVRVVGSGWD